MRCRDLWRLGIETEDHFGVDVSPGSAYDGGMTMTDSPMPAYADSPTGERALICSPESVPQSANFEFRYGGFAFFTLADGVFVAVEA